MPQMAPMNWLILYLIFSLLYILMIIFNYYNFTYLPKYSNLKYQMKINWKW